MSKVVDLYDESQMLDDIDPNDLIIEEPKDDEVLKSGE